MRIFSCILLSLLLFTIAAPVSAATLKAGDEVTLNEVDAVVGDLYVGAGNGVIAGPVAGDLYAAGGNLYIGSVIEQDLVIAGGSVTVAGTVGDDLRVAGGNVVITSSVAGDVVVLGGSLHLAPGSSVGGEVIAAGGNVRIDGEVNGEILAAAGALTINAPVGAVKARVQELTLGRAAEVRGDLVYHSSKEATIEGGATVTGITTFTELKKARKGGAVAGLFPLASLLTLLVAGLLLLWIFRRPTRETTLSAISAPWQQLLRGLIALIVTPVAAVLLFITVLGIPFGLILVWAYLLTLVLACVLFPFVLGTQIEKWLWRRGEYQVTWRTLLIGLVAGAILSLIPLIGWIVIFVFYLFTLGALTQAWQKRIWVTRQ